MPMMSLIRSIGLSRRFLQTSSRNFRIDLNSMAIDKTRNIGIIAHVDAGKTTTTERMLFYSGKTSRIGNVDEGDTVTDYLSQERDRGITIQLAAITIPWDNHKINILDTPGHADFTFEVIRSLRVLDGCVTILDAVAGVEAQTEKVWKQADELEIPKVCYINKMDREGAGFSRTVKEIVSKLRTRVVLCNLPYFESSDTAIVDGTSQFIGVLDVIHMKALKWQLEADDTGREIIAQDLEPETPLFEMVHKSRESMIETLGEFDESLIDSFFENDGDYMKVPPSVLTTAIRRATLAGFAVPVFCGASFKNIGVQPLMDGIVNYLPSPVEINVPAVTSQKSRITTKKSGKRKKAIGADADTKIQIQAQLDPKRGLVVNNNPNLVTALAFKVITHPIRGVMTFIRIYSGTLRSNTNVVNTRTGEIHRLGKLLLMHGDQPEPVDLLGSGNIGVLAGMADDIVTGDTIVSLGNTSKKFSPMESHLRMLPIEIPPPVFSASIEPNTVGDKRYMEDSIKTLLREDPSLHLSFDEETGQNVLSGMGELHLEIVGDRLVNDLKAKAQMGKVVVTYKETLTKPTPSVTVHSNDASGVFVTLSMDSFEGVPSEETPFAYEDGSFLLEMDNNIVIVEPSAMAADMVAALNERRWKSEYDSEQLQDSIVQGCIASLQTGGPITRLPLHSTVVRITSWGFPVEMSGGATPSQLLTVTRQAVNRAIEQHYEASEANFTLLEPVMNVKVMVNSDTLGEVVQDLNSQRKATIHTIEDDTMKNNMDDASWAIEEAERIYVPPDYTMHPAKQLSDIHNRKRIELQAPLREMIGYLSKLRSITQGRGAFDMTYHGMMRVSKDRVNDILNH